MCLDNWWLVCPFSIHKLNVYIEVLHKQYFYLGVLDEHS